MRRDLDGCPIAGALQMVGDKWTMRIIRDLFRTPRTMAIHGSWRTQSHYCRSAARLEKDKIVVRKDFGGITHSEYP